jgi:endogenous inhibitor of DNA gyrase (YacG/DUF329 family)
MSATAGYPASKGVSNDTAASKKRCIGWAVNRNGILIHCPDLVTRWNPRCMYHSTACAHRTLEWVKHGLVLGDRIIFLKACTHCGKKFKTRRPKQRFCSRLCQDAIYRAHNRETIRAYKKVWNARNHPRKQPELKACARCGRNFESSISWQKFCSEKCRDADHHRRHREKIAARRKIWMAANRDTVRAAVRRHHARHRDALNAKTKARYAEKKRRFLELERLAAKLGRPHTRDADRAAYGPRIIELRNLRKSWGQVRIIMNQETGQNRSVSGWRHLIENPAPPAL